MLKEYFIRRDDVPFWKKAGKSILLVLGAFLVLLKTYFLLLLVLYGLDAYISDYRVTTRDTSQSADGRYEMLLQGVGEAVWPFGSSSGRLVLKEGRKRIAKEDFIHINDGMRLGPDNWQVEWEGDSVKVIISGCEQADEQFLFDLETGNVVKERLKTGWKDG